MCIERVRGKSVQTAGSCIGLDLIVPTSVVVLSKPTTKLSQLLRAKLLNFPLYFLYSRHKNYHLF